MVRLDANTPAHQVLKQATDVKSEHRSNAYWWRPPGRQCNSWLQQINNGSLTDIRQSWRAAKDRRHHGSLLRAFTPVCYNDVDDNDDDDDEKRRHMLGQCVLTGQIPTVVVAAVVVVVVVGHCSLSVQQKADKGWPIAYKNGQH